MDCWFFKTMQQVSITIICLVSVSHPCSLVSCLFFSLSIYRSGGSLESVIGHDGCLSEDVVRNFGWDLVKGLKHIHELGIIYSDLKPAKVWICVDVYLGLTV